MTWTVEDFGKYEAFVWEDERLTAHGYPPELGTLQERLQKLQLDQGWKGTQLGGGADGLQGPRSLAFLYSEPKPKPVPVERISRANWKITNPDGTEVKQPAFETFSNAPWFWEDANGDQVFRAPTSGGGTTPNTSYFRSETREMENGGRDKASWGSDDPRILDLELTFTALPHVKQHAVGFQIHDADDDVIMGRLEERKLFIESPHHDDVVLNPNYQLGTFFTIRIQPTATGIVVVYNGNPYELDGVTGDGWYYKYGCYCQARAGQEWKGQIVPKDSFAETRFRGAVLLGG